MKNWILAGAVVAILGFFALETPAQETLKSPAVATVTSQPVQGGRTGVLRRFQERRGRTMTTSTMPTTTTATSTPTVTPPVTNRVESSPSTPSTTPLTTPSTTPLPTTSPVVESRTGLLARMRARR